MDSARHATAVTAMVRVSGAYHGTGEQEVESPTYGSPSAVLVGLASGLCRTRSRMVIAEGRQSTRNTRAISYVAPRSQ